MLQSGHINIHLLNNADIDVLPVFSLESMGQHCLKTQVHPSISCS